MAYRFFLSYAHVSSQYDEVQEFYRKLSENVAELLPRGTDEASVGFWDRNSMEPGAVWGEEIARALRTSRTMVVLVSEQYLDSQYCGRELGAFKARVDKLANRSNLIIPVTWTRVRRALPPPLAALQDGFGVQGFPAVYGERGLARMGRQDRYCDDYTEVVERLANVIVESSERLMDAASIPPLMETPNILRPAEPVDGVGSLGPKNAKFIYIVAHPLDLPSRKQAKQAYGEEGGWSWCPYQPPSDCPIGQVANEVVAQEKLRYYEIPATSNDIAAKIGIAAKHKTPVAVLVDPWSLTVDSYNAVLSQIATLVRDTPEVEESCGVFVSWNNLDADTQRDGEELKSQVSATLSLPGGRSPRHVHKHIDDIDTFRKLLVDAFRAMKLRGLDNTDDPPAGLPTGGGPAPTLSAAPGGAR